MDKKINVLVLADHPLSPSGVGTQTRYMIEALLETGKFRFSCFGGAIKHNNYEPIRVQPSEAASWELGDWTIYPVDGYGTQDMVRSMLRMQKPDIMWFMTDPRFWPWLWEIEDEIRANVPMVYYHVWDNYPYPNYNKNFYRSNDLIAAISKVTYDIVQNVAPDVKSVYLPHSVNPEIFKKHDPEIVEEFRKEHFSSELEKRFTFFWNSRNARRKQSGSLIFWFKDFLDRVGHDKARLLMHTDVRDPNGQDLVAIIEELGLTNGEVVFSQKKMPPEVLSLMYNMCDCTISISDAEGFGLSNLESLSCEVPIIVNMTGGMQEQVTDGEEWFGIGLEPSSKAIIGSLDVPYIYEDRLNGKDVADAMEKMYSMSQEERDELGRKGREHATTNYNFEQYGKKWEQVLTMVHEEMGSWNTRKNYKAWNLIEV